MKQYFKNCKTLDEAKVLIQGITRKVSTRSFTVCEIPPAGSGTTGAG